MKGLADTPTIRRRLLLTLFLPAVLVLAGGTVADYYATVGPLDRAYDDALIDTAVAIVIHEEIRQRRSRARAAASPARGSSARRARLDVLPRGVERRHVRCR